MSAYYRASACALVAATILVATPANAEYQVPVMRLNGDWQTQFGTLRMTIDSFEGAATAQIVDPGSNTPRFRLWRDPSDPGEPDGSAKFYWTLADGRCQAYTLSCVQGRVSLKIDPAGQRFEATTISGRDLEGFARWSGKRLKNSTSAERRLADWVGRWSSSNGSMIFRVEGELLVGEFQKPGAGGLTGRGFVTLFEGGTGAWSLPHASSQQRGHVNLRLSPDKKSFDGTYSISCELDRPACNQATAWTGQKDAPGAEGPAPTRPGTAQPSQSPPVVSQPQPSPQAPATAVGFKAVGKFDVRLDKVVPEDRYWHVYLTLKNASSDILVQAQGLNVRFEDSEGVGVESRQAVRARPGPAELFGSPPPTTRPGGTLPVKFVFDKREGADPAKIIVIEDDKSAEFTLG